MSKKLFRNIKFLVIAFAMIGIIVTVSGIKSNSGTVQANSATPAVSQSNMTASVVTAVDPTGNSTILVKPVTPTKSSQSTKPTTTPKVPAVTSIIAPAPTKVTTPAQSTPQTPTADTYTLADIAQHATSQSCWTAVNGGVYDVTAWIGQHPGGSQAILGMCGIDASDAFNGQHGGQRRPTSELASFKIGTLAQ